MEIENIIQYAPFAVGLKPSAMRGEARLRGLARAVAVMEIENLIR